MGNNDPHETLERPLEWRQAGNWAVTSGSWIICRNLVGPLERFTLYHAHTRIGTWDTEQEAKDWVASDAAGEFMASLGVAA